jgi:hypothetical protein
MPAIAACRTSGAAGEESLNTMTLSFQARHWPGMLRVAKPWRQEFR